MKLRYRMFMTWFPFYRDMDSGRVGFIKPRFRLKVHKGTPCPTQWLYDWILNLGYLSIWRRSDYEMGKP